MYTRGYKPSGKNSIVFAERYFKSNRKPTKPFNTIKYLHNFCLVKISGRFIITLTRVYGVLKIYDKMRIRSFNCKRSEWSNFYKKTIDKLIKKCNNNILPK